MTLRLLIAFTAALALAGCGVKSDLEKPSSQKAEVPNKNEKDPSKPPSQLGK